MSALSAQLKYVIAALWYLYDLLVATWNNVVDLLTLYLVLFFLGLSCVENISDSRFWQIQIVVANSLALSIMWMAHSMHRYLVPEANINDVINTGFWSLIILLKMLIKLLFAELGVVEEEVELPQEPEQLAQPELPEPLPEPLMLSDLLLGLVRVLQDVHFFLAMTGIVLALVEIIRSVH